MLNKNSDQDNDCGLFSLSPKIFTILSLLIALVLVEDLTSDEQNSLGNFLLSVGQDMLTYSTQASLLQSQKDNEDTLRRLEMIKEEIKLLEERLRE